MNPTHYPSKELCQRLKELGWKQETEKSWEDLGHRQRVADTHEGSLCPAPSVAELGEMLANANLKSSLLEIKCGLYHTGTFHNFFAQTIYDSHEDKTFCADTEADARAKLLIQLAERGEITM